MIIVCGGTKGGTGKTTIATNLAVCCANKKKRVLLVDADEQRSACDWADQRHDTDSEMPEGSLASITTIALTGKSVYQQLQLMKADYDFCIVDAGGRDTTSQRSALTVADKLILPFKPRSFDVWTIGKIQELMEEIYIINPGIKPYAVINQGDPTGTDNLDAITMLVEQKFLDPLAVTIHHRKCYANAASFGLGVIELPRQDRKAAEEIWRLHNFVCE